jgi:lipoprotein-anchoring transpeptidase ErfK/SrfK
MHGPINAVVYKSRFAMDLYLGPPEQPGALYITSFPVGLGENDSTPTGTWQVEAGRKLKNPTYYSPRGEGLIDADDPKNPLGERWIGLTGIDGHALGKQSYGIHGTIDEASIGKMQSMGCIRLKNADVEWLFDLLMDGKSIVVVKE